jgi:hypothetical protein
VFIGDVQLLLRERVEDGRLLGYGLGDEVSITSSSVPEPATSFLLGSGLIGLRGFRRRFGKS